MKLKKFNYKKLILDENSRVKATNTRLIENSRYTEVEISPKQCRKSCRFFSRLKNTIK